MGVYDKEPLSCPGQSDKIFCTFTKLQGCIQPSTTINVALFWKISIFLDRLKDSSQIKRNYVKTFDVRQDAMQTL